MKMITLGVAGALTPRELRPVTRRRPPSTAQSAEPVTVPTRSRSLLPRWVHLRPRHPQL